MNVNAIRNLFGLGLASVLLVLGSCSSATSSGDSKPSPFTGTWLSQVSTTHTYQYVFASDMTFEYTDTNNGTVINHFKGTYSYQEPSSYTEHVTHQDNGAGFVALGAGAWTTPYTYAFIAGNLEFDDGAGYNPVFMKQ